MIRSLKIFAVLIISLGFLNSAYAKDTVLKDLWSWFTVTSNGKNTCVKYKSVNTGICRSESEGINLVGNCSEFLPPTVPNVDVILPAELDPWTQKICLRNMNVNAFRIDTKYKKTLWFILIRKMLYEGAEDFLVNLSNGKKYNIATIDIMGKILIWKNATYFLSESYYMGQHIYAIDKYTKEIRLLIAASGINDRFPSCRTQDKYGNYIYCEIKDFELLTQKRIRIFIQNPSTWEVEAKIISATPTFHP